MTIRVNCNNNKANNKRNSNKSNIKISSKQPIKTLPLPRIYKNKLNIRRKRNSG
jgi:hypothetical protein